MAAVIGNIDSRVTMSYSVPTFSSADRRLDKSTDNKTCHTKKTNGVEKHILLGG